MRILVFGDSITYGAWDSKGGWVDRLKQDLNQLYIETGDHINHCHQVINLGVGGDTSTGVLKRIEAETQARYSPSWPCIIVIAIGTNDSRSVDEPGNLQTPIEVYEQNLKQIIELAKQHSNQVLLVGPFPLAEEEVPFKNYYYSQAALRQYDEIITRGAEQASVTKVEMFELIIKRTDLAKLFFNDKIHPNDAGHELIASLVKPELEKLLMGSPKGT